MVIHGGDLKFDGELSTDFTLPSGSEGLFTGAYADGTPFVIPSVSIDPLADVTLVETPIPAPDLTPFTIHKPVMSAPFGLRGGQTATLVEGGSLRNGFRVIDSTLEIEGGDFSAVAIRSTVNIEAGRGGISAGASSLINISGGTLTGFNAWDGGALNATGGEFFGVFSAGSGGVVNVSGGEWRPLFYLVRAGSSFNLFGREFYLDDKPIDSLKPGEPFVIADRFASLTGTLADGSEFGARLDVFGDNFFNLFSRDATVTVTLIVPEPTTAALLLMAVGSACRRR